MSEIDLTPSPSTSQDQTNQASLTTEPLDEESIPADELRAILLRMGDEAKRRAFAAGIGIVVLKDGHLVEINAEGDRVDLGVATIPASSALP